MPVKEDNSIRVAPLSEDKVFDNALRPRSPAEYVGLPNIEDVGQTNILRQPDVAIGAAEQRAEKIIYLQNK